MKPRWAGSGLRFRRSRGWGGGWECVDVAVGGDDDVFGFARAAFFGGRGGRGGEGGELVGEALLFSELFGVKRAGGEGREERLGGVGGVGWRGGGGAGEEVFASAGEAGGDVGDVGEEDAV